MLVKMICSQCGAPMEFDDSRNVVFCQYCGNKMVNLAQRVEVTQNINMSGTVVHRFDNIGKPNLIINYSSKSMDVGMKIRIVSTNEKSFFVNGQSISYHLPFGEQKIVLKIGKINYNRQVYLPENNAPVTIYASWNGRAHITIDQPPYEKPQPVQPVPMYRAMKVCSLCNSAVSVGSKFCTKCGAPFKTQNTLLCPVCGRTLSTTDRFCVGCGTKNPFVS